MNESPRYRDKRISAPSLFQIPTAKNSDPAPPNRNTRHRTLLVFLAAVAVLQIATLAAALALAHTPTTEPAADAYRAPARTEPAQPASEPPQPTPPAKNLKAARTPQQVTASQQPPAAAPLPEPQPSALQMRGVEITQGIQVFHQPQLSRCNPDPTQPDNIFCNNSIPLVAGRHTLIRTYLACNDPCPTEPTTVQLRVFKDGIEQSHLTRQLPPETLASISDLPLDDLRADLTRSVNFEFLPPPNWMEGEITFSLAALPQGQSSLTPATFEITREFVPKKTLRIAYLPIQFKDTFPANPQDVSYWLQRMYPVPDVEYYRLPVPDMKWDGDLSKSDILRQLMYSYWFFVQFHPPAERPDQLFGWLPQEIYNGGASDPYWCPNCAGPHSSRVAFGGLRPEQDIGGPRILVHEIAHNLGAQHAWSPTYNEDSACFRAEGADIRVDPHWPYAQTPHIQEFGIDLYSNPPVIYPPSRYDLMTYCAQPWISPHTYRKIFDSPFLQADGATPEIFAEFQPQIETTESGTLLVSGVIYPNGTVAQPEVVKLTGDAFGSAAGFAPPPPVAPPPGDDYCLNVEAADHSLLAQRCFDAGFIDLETGQPTEPATFFVSLPDVDLNRVDKVSVTRQQVEQASVSASNSAPQVEIIEPAGNAVLRGRQNIRWQASDADGDSLRFDLFYSPNSGERWLPLAVRLSGNSTTINTAQLPAGQHLLLRVVASDGFNSAVAQLEQPLAVRPLPENSLSVVGPAVVDPGESFEVTIVANQVTPGLFGAEAELYFDPQLAQVEQIEINPALGLVAASEIDNQAGRATFTASRKGQVDNLTGDITLARLLLTAGPQNGTLTLSPENVQAGIKGGIPLQFSEIQGLSITISP